MRLLFVTLLFSSSAALAQVVDGGIESGAGHYGDPGEGHFGDPSVGEFGAPKDSSERARILQRAEMRKLYEVEVEPSPYIVLDIPLDEN